MPEVILRKVIDYGIKQLRTDRAAFEDLFNQFTVDELGQDYGEQYVDDMWAWFSVTKIPVVQAWSFNAQRIPSISIHLANESEDESKAAIGDIFGQDETSEVGTGVFTVMVDVGIHANRGGDHVLWLYYIVAYILFKHKMMAHRLGLKITTFSASDYSKNAELMANNIWTRWIRFRCTTQNFWSADAFLDIEDVNVEAKIMLDEAYDIVASEDVDISTIDTTANEGIKASRTNDEEGDEDINI